MTARGARGSVYLAVVAVVAMVGVLALTGVALRKQMIERSMIGSEAASARRLARSATELILARSQSNPEWFRTESYTGTIFENLMLDGSGATLSASVVDANTKGAPGDATRLFRLVADARSGRARSRLSFLLETPDDPLGSAVGRHSASVCYWPMDEVNQAQAEEQLRSLHGVYGSPSVAGMETHVHGGPAPRMGWNSEFVRVPHDSAFELVNGTLAFWARINLEPWEDYRATLVSKERHPTDASLSLILAVHKDHLVYTLYNSSQSESIRVPNDKLRFGEWQHFAITWGEDGMELFVDGERLASSSSIRIGLGQVGTSPFPWYRPANTQDWYFGVRDVPQYGFQQSASMLGSLARVALFNDQLDESQIARLRALSSVEPGFVLVPGSFARVTD